MNDHFYGYSDDVASTRRSNKQSHSIGVRSPGVWMSDSGAVFSSNMRRSVKQEAHHTTNEGGNMSQISREELDAKLALNKAEAVTVAEELKREMAQWREQNTSQLAQLTIAINALSAKVDGKMDSVDGDIKAITGNFTGLHGQISGINTAIGGIQSGISTRLAIFGIVIAFLVAIPGVISALNKDTSAPTTQPIIIQMPQPIQTNQPSQPSQPDIK